MFTFSVLDASAQQLIERRDSTTSSDFVYLGSRERQLLEQMHYNLLLGGFFGFTMDDAERDASRFSRRIRYPASLSRAAIWGPIPNDKEVGRGAAFFPRAGQRLVA